MPLPGSNLGATDQARKDQRRVPLGVDGSRAGDVIRLAPELLASLEPSPSIIRKMIAEVSKKAVVTLVAWRQTDSPGP